MDAFDSARRAGMPRTDEERMENHYNQYGTYSLPPRGTGLGSLKSIGVIKDVTAGTFDKSDLIGLLVGGAAGWLVAKKWPTAVVKYIGIAVGAELGIIAARAVRYL
jgi:hypothetical protein